MAPMAINCAIVGVAGYAFPVKIDTDKSVGHLKQAIHDQKPLPVTYEADSLQLFLAKTEDGEWLNSKDPLVLCMRKGDCPCEVKSLYMKEELGDPTHKISKKFPSDLPEEVIHVLVVVPGIVHEDVVWCGSVGEDIHLNDERTLARSALTADIIDRLDETHVVLVQSPPMTGKTSLATLLCQALVNKHKEEKKKAVVCSFSVAGMVENETFEGFFKNRCKLDWVYAKGVLPTRDRAVYLVLDEAQLVYNDSASTFIAFWELVKLVQIDAAYQVRIVMFADYGFNVEHTRHGTSIGCDDRMMFGINELNFRPAEVFEYITKWFKGAKGLSSSAMKTFCTTVQELTGGHVGLCTSVIDALNKVYEKNWSDPPSAKTWIRMLQGGWLYEPDDGALFQALTQTRAVEVLETLRVEDLDRLERAVCGVNPWSNGDIVEQCLHNGILVRGEWQLNFSSPVMWRYFVKLRVGRSPRALDTPKLLPEMIARVMEAMDYTNVRQELCSTFLPNDIGIPAWQLELYKAVYRCTPSSFVTSADVGALFGASGFIDFTIASGGLLWGIELLREASNLAESIERFSPGGRYSSLGLTELCLVDFRCVASIDGDEMERIAADMRLSKNLFVVCYDARMTSIVVFNSDLGVVYQALGQHDFVKVGIKRKHSDQ